MAFRVSGLIYHFCRPELAWVGTETNQFGTDEFLQWCEIVGTEPYLCLNFGTGTPFYIPQVMRLMDVYQVLTCI